MEKLDYLIDYLLKENKDIRINNIPTDKESKKRLYRSLCNIREAKPIDDEYIQIENSYLQEELKKKEVTKIENIKTILYLFPDSNLKYKNKICIWKGDITTLKIAAIVNAANSQGLGCFIPCHNCIDNAIHSSSGVQLRLECKEKMEQIEELETGKAVIIMEPVKGGMLANPPEPVQEVFKKANKDASFASWAIKFAANLEGIITVLSGMSSIEQMDDNISFMKDFKGLTEDEKKVIDEAQKVLNSIPLIPCTTCNYCAKVCPMNIGISGSFTAMNYLTLYRDKAAAKHQEEWLVGGHGRKPASECIKCGRCEEVCPQHIKIREELEKVVAALGE